MTFIISGFNTCFILDFSIDFNIIKVEELKTFEINNVDMMADLENYINLKEIGLTFKIKINHQGQVTRNVFLRSLTLRMLESTPNRVNSRHTAGDTQGHMKNVYDLEFQGQPSRSRVCFKHFSYP